MPVVAAVQDVNEKKSCSLQVSFFDEDKVATIPSKLFIRIDDAASATVIRARIEIVSGLAAVMTIAITSTENRILDTTHSFETRVVTLEWDFGVDKHSNDEIRYKIKNLDYIT